MSQKLSQFEAADSLGRSVGVVGVGGWGRNHVRVLHELGVLAAVSDNNEQLSKSTSETYDVPELPFEQILADDSISALVIATPPVSHFDLACRAIRAGKDVLVEKPLSLTLAEAEETNRLAAEKGRILMVGHLLRHHPAFVKLEELVKGGVLGELKHVASHRLSWGRVRSEENILWSFAPHDISMILALTEDMPQTVEAHGYCYLNPPITDISATHLGFEGGKGADVFVSWLSPRKEHRLVVTGSQGIAIFDDVQDWPNKLQLLENAVDWNDGQLLVAKAQPMPVPLEHGEPLKLELLHYLHCCATRELPLTDGAEGCRVLSILEQAEASMASRGSSSGGGR